MTELRHYYTLDRGNAFDSVADFYKRRGEPFVLHAHLLSKACTGNCPTFNLPNEDCPYCDGESPHDETCEERLRRDAEDVLETDTTEWRRRHDWS